MISFFDQYPVAIPFIAILSAEVIKALIDLIRRRRTIRFLSSGGMPSGHSAFVSATVVVIATKTGIGSPLFMLAAVVAVVVMYDAIHLRLEAGKHAHAINLLRNNNDLEESLGHTHLEVIFGALFGGVLSFLLLN
ncbi:divergent PAP2 family protein [Candidatus Peregrinibacteria bacterium]|nr:divergent PAP2 family protein [Candidatus Peregrinibacteria bacterium]